MIRALPLFRVSARLASIGLFQRCQQKIPRGKTAISNQAIPDMNNKTIQKIQKTRLIACTARSLRLIYPSPSAGTASITCMDDRASDRLVNTKSKGDTATCDPLAIRNLVEPYRSPVLGTKQPGGPVEPRKVELAVMISL